MKLAHSIAFIAPLLAVSAATVTAPPPPAPSEHIRISMRDGVRLDTNVFLPYGRQVRVPAILIRTPYGKGTTIISGHQVFLEHGFAIVMQDVRGRFASEGVFDTLEHEGRDGYDTVDWVARQPWSNGRVGMLGGSYLGIVQWKAAVLDNPHLKAIFPVVSGDDDYFDRFYSPGGPMKLGHRLLWMSENLLAPGTQRPLFNEYIYHLPLRTADKAATGQTLGFYQRALSHPSYDNFWRSMSVRQKLPQMNTPVFSVGGWYDNYVESDLDAFAALRKRGVQAHILIGPWPHNMSWKPPVPEFGPHAWAPVRRLQLDWFERWLKPEPLHEEHVQPPSSIPDLPARIFVMGRNEWRDEREWPLARTRFTPLYLTGGGPANTVMGAGELEWRPEPRLEADKFTYDPKKPVPTLGGSVCCNPKIFPWGPMDQRPVERRNDVLVYTTQPLRRELEVTGPVQVVLYVSTSAPDTDFTAKLVDVFPDGEARNLTDGILRLRYRNGPQKPSPAHPGEVYAVTIDAGVTSTVFLPGHAIRLEVSSSNFPRFDRNANTGRPAADEKSLRKAQQTVYHGKDRDSHILLPVIPEAVPDSGPLVHGHPTREHAVAAHRRVG